MLRFRILITTFDNTFLKMVKPWRSMKVSERFYSKRDLKGVRFIVTSRTAAVTEFYHVGGLHLSGI
jgi:hypothetical protein